MTVNEAIKFMQKLKSKGTKHLIVGVWTADIFEIKDDKAWGKVAKDIEDNATHLWDEMFSNLQFAVDSVVEHSIIRVTRTGDEE